MKAQKARELSQTYMDEIWLNIEKAAFAGNTVSHAVNMSPDKRLALEEAGYELRWNADMTCADIHWKYVAGDKYKLLKPQEFNTGAWYDAGRIVELFKFSQGRYIFRIAGNPGNKPYFYYKADDFNLEKVIENELERVWSASE